MIQAALARQDVDEAQVHLVTDGTRQGSEGGETAHLAEPAARLRLFPEELQRQAAGRGEMPAPFLRHPHECLRLAFDLDTPGREQLA